MVFGSMGWIGIDHPFPHFLACAVVFSTMEFTDLAGMATATETALARFNEAGVTGGSDALARHRRRRSSKGKAKGKGRGVRRNRVRAPSSSVSDRRQQQAPASSTSSGSQSLSGSSGAADYVSDWVPFHARMPSLSSGRLCRG